MANCENAYTMHLIYINEYIYERHYMRKLAPLLLILFLLSSCKNITHSELSHEERISFFSGYGVVVNAGRPFYSSSSTIPKIFNSIWEIRNIFSKNLLKLDISKYKGSQCTIYMYPVASLPFQVKKGSEVETRAVVICCEGNIICAYIEFISELRTLPYTALSGKSLVELSGIKWDTWKNGLDSDDNKYLVICQYYNALRTANFEDAYSYLYDKKVVSREDFIKKAGENKLPYIDFVSIDQYKAPTDNECFFIVEANISTSNAKGKAYQIFFDLKKDANEKEYGGWKIYSTKIK